MFSIYLHSCTKQPTTNNQPELTNIFMSIQGKSPAFEKVLSSYLSRRQFLGRATALSAAGFASACSLTVDESYQSSLMFNEVSHNIPSGITVPDKYHSQVLIRWGDPIFDGVSEFDPDNQSAEDQQRQFGYNNDFVGFLPLPQDQAQEQDQSDHGLLVVNHEYTNPQLMYPSLPDGERLTKDYVDVDIAAHGMSVIEVVRDGDNWVVNKKSALNRRITPHTLMEICGPAAGSKRLKTASSHDGVSTWGTYGNCAGGVTPWGTVLTAEENVDSFFSGDYADGPEAENYRRFGVFKKAQSWGDFYERWNLSKNPAELLHVGWIVEVDPYDPKSIPKKRTALGRFKHEACNIHINPDNRVVAYSGDDQRFEYIYKFVSKSTFDPNHPRANLNLLDEGTLYVARFEDTGRLTWLPLVFGTGPLTEKNGFSSQADISLDTRKAADLVGATPMDRPEDIEVNPKNARVYAMLTNNSARTAEQVDAANPRAHNSHGQILEFWPHDGDHAAEVFQWDMFLLAGNPKTSVTQYHNDISEHGWLSCPDNCAFDGLGNLWVGSDGAQKAGIADGLWVTETEGPARALTKRFMSIPIGAELCGPFFTPNSENLFCAIQHPANSEGSTYASPSTRWPDFDESTPPRPSLVVTRKNGGGRVGS